VVAAYGRKSVIGKGKSGLIISMKKGGTETKAFRKNN